MPESFVLPRRCQGPKSSNPDEPVAANLAPLRRVLERASADRLRRFFLCVIKPRGLQGVAARFCQLGPSLEEAKTIL
jgi:hypothetical protein